MGRIQASMAKISTDFEPLEPAIYDFEIEKVEEVEKDDIPGVGKGLAAYVVHSKVIASSEGETSVGKIFRDYINVRLKTGEFSEPGLASLKKYYEAIFGKETVAGWSDEDYDTDMLRGKRWKGQLGIESYTNKAGKPAKKNEILAMEAA